MAERSRFSCISECTDEPGRSLPEIFPRSKSGISKLQISKKHSRKSYTTNMVNGNIHLQKKFLKLPKMTPVKIKLHRPVPEGWKLKSVTVSRESSGKYFASLLFDCENQAVEKRQAEKFLGIDFAMHGLCVFSTGERAGYPMFYRSAEKKLAREQRKISSISSVMTLRRSMMRYVWKI